MRDGSDGSVACDSYHRYEEDLDLVAGARRRLVPLLDRLAADPARRASAGSRARGLDYYDRLVDAALARGVAPTATLYHWDLPQPLEDRDGWLNRDTAEAFADYATIVHDRLGDRVRRLGHPQRALVCGLPRVRRRRARAGSARGRRPPTGPRTTCCSATAWPPRGCTRPAPTDVGIVLNLAPFWPEDPADAEVVAATDDIDALRNRVWLGPLVDGRVRRRAARRRARAGRPGSWSGTVTSHSCRARPTGSA